MLLQHLNIFLHNDNDFLLYIFYLSNISKFFFIIRTDFCIFIWFLLLFCNNFIFFFLKLIIFFGWSLKSLQNFFCNLYLYTSCLFSMLLNEDIVDIEKPDAICLLTFVLDYFSGLFLHPSVFWRRGVVVITTAQLHSTKLELRFCAGSNPARRFEMVRISDNGPGWK